MFTIMAANVSIADLFAARLEELEAKHRESQARLEKTLASIKSLVNELEAQHLESYKRLQARLERIQVGLDELKELNKLG